MIALYNNIKSPREVLTSDRVGYYIQQAQQLGETIVSFTTKDVDFQTSTIQAEVYDGKWVNQVITFPDLLFNEQCVVSDYSVLPDHDIRLQREIPCFFHLIDDKWAVQQKLEAQNVWGPLLIPTVSLESFDQLMQMLEQQGELVLKPTNASQGRGIFKVKKAVGIGYEFMIKDMRHTYSYQKLKSFISKLCSQQDYIIQPFIQSRTPEGEAFHLRVHLIRNEVGEWIVLSSFADVAKKGRFITNHSAYANIRSEEFLHTFFENSVLLNQQLIQQALALASTIDAFYPFTVPELALDFALENGRTLRFFEANTGPEIFAFKEERETLRAQQLITFAHNIDAAMSSIPTEQRYGRYFKVGK